VVIDRKLRKIRAGAFCEVDIKVKDGRLSVCGIYGRVRTEAAAKKEAIGYWESFFEENPAEEFLMARKFDKRFKSSRHAAKFVVESDGDFHGLDVVATVGKKVLISEGWGQITDEIRKWFPRVAPLLPWHMNDMRAGCEHQRKMKWGPGKTIALSPDHLTDAQHFTIAHDMELERDRLFAKEMELFQNDLRSSSKARVAWISKHSSSGVCTIHDMELFDHLLTVHLESRALLQQKQLEWREALIEEVTKKIPVEKFKGAIYQDCIGAPCPECGYKYGTAWVMEPLPLNVIQLAASVYKELEVGGGT
jgi:hypothetical protein